MLFSSNVYSCSILSISLSRPCSDSSLIKPLIRRDLFKLSCCLPARYSSHQQHR
ncbi:hypothetical protein M3J09_011455 [Ascochyta lentis]